MKASELQDHMTGTYFSLRWGMVAIAFAFPLVLLIAGLIVGKLGLQHSLSAYYHTPVRDVFVGLLVAIGACLYLYKGFSTPENVALNLAGLFVVGVAMFPTPLPVHLVVALSFFLCIAYVAICRAPDTLCLITDEELRERYRKIYRTLGILMIISPAIAVIASLMTGQRYVVVIAEWLAVWIFAAYWLVKSREMAKTEAEILALEEKLQLKSPPAASAGAKARKLFSSQEVQQIA